MKEFNKNLAMRFLIALIVLPILFVAIFIQTSFDHLLLFLMTLTMSIIGTLEMISIFKAQNIFIPKALTVCASVLLPITAYLINNNYIGEYITLPGVSLEILFTLFVLVGLTTGILKKEATDFKSTLFRISGTILTLIYPAYLICYVVKMGKLEYSNFVYLSFFVLGFANDVFAYSCGLLFGKKSLKPFTVSPKKSLAGYIGGILFAILFGIGLYFLKPILFGNKIWFAIVSALLVALLCNVGDLVESAFKRSSNLKDSGTVMLGRGGVLDSIDSLLFAAPLFYYLLFFLQNFELLQRIG